MTATPYTAQFPSSRPSNPSLSKPSPVPIPVGTKAAPKTLARGVANYRILDDAIQLSQGEGLLWASETGARVWAGGLTLAEILQKRLPDLPFPSHDEQGPPICPVGPHTNLLELGCGLGLVSITAAKRGARVTATDGERSIQKLAARNLKGNRLPEDQAAAFVLKWGDEATLSKLTAERGPFNLVVGSDLIYGSNPAVWEKLGLVLNSVLRARARTIALIAETERKEGVLYGEFWDRVLGSHGLERREIDVSGIVGQSEGVVTTREDVPKKVHVWVVWRPEGEGETRSLDSDSDSLAIGRDD